MSAKPRQGAGVKHSVLGKVLFEHMALNVQSPPNSPIRFSIVQYYTVLQFLTFLPETCSPISAEGTNS